MFLQRVLRNLNFATTLIGVLPVVAGVSILFWVRLSRRRTCEQILLKSLPQKLVVISGCDSGLGLAMAYWAAKKGYRLLAGCLNANSAGAILLRTEFNEMELTLEEVDVTKKPSLEKFYNVCQNILCTESSTKLWAMIPNAAIGSFGEFFWMTENQSRRMMEVNFWGSVNLTQTFHPLLLQHKGRLIVVTSDCADFPLPSLSIYSATKAALENWAAALRLEVAKFGVTVTSFQPGNFPTQTRLFSSQRSAFEEMRDSMSAEDKYFYGDYFYKFNESLIQFFDTNSPTQLQDDNGVRKTFFHLLEDDMRRVPVASRNPPILKFIHFLFQYLPTRASDWLKICLIKPPVWKPREYPQTKD